MKNQVENLLKDIEKFQKEMKDGLVEPKAEDYFLHSPMNFKLAHLEYRLAIAHYAIDKLLNNVHYLENRCLRSLII